MNAMVVAIAAALALTAPGQPGDAPATTAAEAHARAVAFHDARRLDEASREYARTLSLDPSRPASTAELTIIRRFAPRIHTTPTEYFSLRDVAAVLHPTERLIAYHLFWDDDIDFPEDNDPCDHELVWVRFSRDGLALERFWTYFHGRILEGTEAALGDARAHAMRPRVNVQWGKHGSLPNGWETMPIYVEASLVGSYAAAVRLVADQVRGPMRLRESHGPFSNPEGADFEVTLEHLQPWEAREQRTLQHAHAFHMRYYHTALSSKHLERVSLATPAGPRDFYRLAASAHYEVEHTNPNHADVEMCPICGRTGEYAQQQGNLVELVHDPLGLELLMHGTIRGEAVRFEHDQAPVGGIQSARDRFSVQQHVFPGLSGDRNTLRLGVIVLGSRR